MFVGDKFSFHHIACLVVMELHIEVQSYAMNESILQSIMPEQFTTSIMPDPSAFCR